MRWQDSWVRCVFVGVGGSSTRHSTHTTTPPQPLSLITPPSSPSPSTHTGAYNTLAESELRWELTQTPKLVHILRTLPKELLLPEGTWQYELRGMQKAPLPMIGAPAPAPAVAAAAAAAAPEAVAAMEEEEEAVTVPMEAEATEAAAAAAEEEEEEMEELTEGGAIVKELLTSIIHRVVEISRAEEERRIAYEVEEERRALALKKAREEAECAARVSGCRLTFLGTPAAAAQQQQQQHCHCHSTTALHSHPFPPSTQPSPAGTGAAMPSKYRNVSSALLQLVPPPHGYPVMRQVRESSAKHSSTAHSTSHLITSPLTTSPLSPPSPVICGADRVLSL